MGGGQHPGDVVGDARRSSSVSASNWTGIGVSVIEMKRSPSWTRLTFALSESFGENIDCTRWNSDRQGSVANSE